MLRNTVLACAIAFFLTLMCCLAWDATMQDPHRRRVVQRIVRAYVRRRARSRARA